MKIKKWICRGHNDSQAVNTKDLLDEASGALDNACSWDMIGEILFEGEDGKFYVGCVEFVIGEANPEYVKDRLEEEKYNEAS